MEGRRYVIQEHTTPQGVHWDLMLEDEGILRTFRLAQTPAAVLERTVQAERIFDHPLRFLTYEGPVQQRTGRVRIVDHGLYYDREHGEKRWDLSLEGAVLNGDFSLTQAEKNTWHFTCECHR